MLATVNWLKTTGVWLVTALWLVTSFCVYPQRSQTPSAHPAEKAAVEGYTQAILSGVKSPAILPSQSARPLGFRPVSPVLDGPDLCAAPFEPGMVCHPQSDAPGLAPVSLAQSWQFILRAAAFPRSPNYA